ncbi:competence protein ComA [Pantoea deleyi]|uniref:CinA family protein n=1 Tax=Pantoea deleyi TaxID=470932 RepID=A0A506PYX1_9GAMM|nr:MULTISPECIES: CinA family protein [Pantoea]ORM77279.1 competence protein ComA [Pantoea deleyi]PZL93371.1 competence protein ComA [Pantoea sp. ARC607]TPV38405.1 CinA family protein [Pantoea deleyi]
MATSLDQTAEQLGKILLASGWHLTTAESCTAGLISMTLAAVESSGDFYTSGFVTYSENAKIRLLGVHPDTLKQHTAVSEQTAREMVQGACARSGEPVGLSITGYAGPDGGDDGTPAGTIWFGWMLPDGTDEAECHQFSGDPKSVMEQGTEFALQGLIKRLRRAAR